MLDSEIEMPCWIVKCCLWREKTRVGGALNNNTSSKTNRISPSTGTSSNTLPQADSWSNSTTEGTIEDSPVIWLRTSKFNWWPDCKSQTEFVVNLSDLNIIHTDKIALTLWQAELVKHTAVCKEKASYQNLIISC